MAKDRPPSYTPAPGLPDDPVIRTRFETIVQVLAQTQSVSGAARDLDLSRNHFQTILHRVIAAMLVELTPKPAGRPAKPEREAKLEAEVARLQAQLEAMTARTEMIERMMGVVGDIASGRARLGRGRQKRTTPAKPEAKPKPEDPEPATRTPTSTVVAAMAEIQAPLQLWSRVLGLSESTLRRQQKPRVVKEREPRRYDASACASVRETVRRTHGLVGARGLARRHQLPRRLCAWLKHEELQRLETERRKACARVTVAAPGLVRGFDAMHVVAGDQKAYWLVAADAAIPFRTSVATVTSYDAASVVAALAADFEAHGPPLVLRLDRIAAQRAPEVAELLERFAVLALHGPPRYPRYYGQLERQNREHREWYSRLHVSSLGDLASAAEEMRTSLNTLWARPTLDGWTAAEVWNTRRRIDVDRRALRAAVNERTTGLVSSGVESLRARRIAIETELTNLGLLAVHNGGWC